eukprot:5880143-Pleurochrysis_carterae.AAC.1
MEISYKLSYNVVLMKTGMPRLLRSLTAAMVPVQVSLGMRVYVGSARPNSSTAAFRPQYVSCLTRQSSETGRASSSARLRFVICATEIRHLRYSDFT